MFGLNDKEKQVKELLAQLGCEASVFKNFKNGYEKMERRLSTVRLSYEESLKATGRVYIIAQELERYFAREVSLDLAGVTKEMKHLQSSLAHEFLISSQDREFFSTYITLMQKLPGCDRNDKDRLLMQSEVENLLHMLKEALDHPSPDLHAYAYFGINHRDSELFDLSAPKKRTYILDIYNSTLIEPVLSAAAGRGQDSLYQELTKQIKEMSYDEKAIGA